MRNIKNNSTTFNMACSLLQQDNCYDKWIHIAKNNFKTFDSDVNGLVSSLNQFLSYVSLIEGGLTGVVSANLYKPFGRE